MPKRKKSLPVYEYPKLENGKKRYYIRPYIDGKQRKIRKNDRGEKWLGYDGYVEACQECTKLINNPEVYKKNYCKDDNNNEIITFEKLFLLKNSYDEIHHTNSGASRITYEQKINKHVIPYIGNIEINNLSKEHYDIVLNHLTKYTITHGVNRGKSLKNITINSILMTIISILEHGCKFYNLETNVFKKYGLINNDKDKPIDIDISDFYKKNRVISPDDWQKVAKVMENKINKSSQKNKLHYTKLSLFLTTEYILLTRVGETQGLKYKNFKFNQNMYLLYEAWNKRLKQITPTKNRKLRLLYIPQGLMKSYINLYEIAKEQDDFNENDFIFSSVNDKNIPLSRSTIDRYRREIFKLANVRYSTNHQLRHAGISNAMYNQVDVSALSDMAGHKKEIMFENYVQTLKNANQGLIENLNQLYIPTLFK